MELGNCYLHVGRFEEAAEMYDHVLKYEPKSFHARLNRAHYRLASEMFQEGWADYRYRFHASSVALRALPFPDWRGEALEGKRLLIFAEQGLGDEIMFASCFPEIIARAAHCFIECEKRLEPIFRRSFPGATILPAVGKHEPPWLRTIGPIDYQVAAGDLPSYLRNAWADFPRHAGYLKADPARVAHWRARLDALGPGLKVGISWRGGTPATRSSARTIPLPAWLPLLQTAGCRFVSLQYGKAAEELAAFGSQAPLPIAHWPDAIDDYDETAALVCALDLVISVCTAIIHLTGALGRPVWVMVPAVPEWRYLRKGEALPWYPSARLFRQAELWQWAPVVQRVEGALASLAAGRLPGSP
jgi:tetratricopeptide (TPR) repeat protein